jgi:uncharacterized protein DUF4012
MDWQSLRQRAGAQPALRLANGLVRGVARISARVHRMRPMQRFLTIVLVCGFLVVPVLGAASAVQDYLQLRGLGQDAIHHLLTAKNALLPTKKAKGNSLTACGLGTTPTPTPLPTTTPGSGSSGGDGLGSLGVPDQAHIDLATHELRLAQSEFREIGALIDRPSPVLAFGLHTPVVNSKISSVRQMLYVGDDATAVALNLLAAATPVLNNLRSGALSASGGPLLTQAQADTLRAAVVNSMSSLNDIEARIGQVNVDDLPISACQRTEYSQLVAKLPDARNLLAQAPQLFDMLTWLGGVDHERQYLVQMMDNWELRPTGGFTGLYGVVSVSGARVRPFTLHDVNHFDYGPIGYGVIAGRRPPAVYDWWPFGNWGLRDSSLSADFPTNAHLVLGVFKDESGAQQLGLDSANIDGLIQLTPLPIEHILQYTGPISVPDYGDTVTASNFEERVHYWQNDYGAIAREKAICQQSTDNTQVTKRKCFTEAVAQLLEQRVRQLPLSTLLTLAQVILDDVRAHEIGVYLTDPAKEQFLVTFGLAPRLNTTPGVDSLMLDQANVSIAKSSPNVDVNISDTVTLDANGGALHHASFTFANTLSKVNPYSYITTYRDYVRVYVPAAAQLRYANGFDTGTPVCWVAPASDPKAAQPARFAALPPCPTTGFFTDKSLACPAGGWGPGPEGSNIFGNDGTTYWPVEDTGYPPNMASDVPGRAMYGGYVVVPRHCTATITLDYFVPNVALPAATIGARAPAYSYIIERQAGAPVTVSVHIQPATGVAEESTKPVQVNAALAMDMTFTVPRLIPRIAQP